MDHVARLDTHQGNPLACPCCRRHTGAAGRTPERRRACQGAWRGQAQAFVRTLAAAAVGLAAALAQAAPLVPAAPAPGPVLMWQQAGPVRAAGAWPAEASTPLGSLWKLFVYSRLVAGGAPERPYRCEAVQRPQDDAYCCEPGDTITRDEALARSCGAYFAPQRLGLGAADWRAFWQAQGAPAWVTRLEAMAPDTRVPPAELLAALGHVPTAARLAAREALLPVGTRDAAVLAAFGSGPRMKTWSWHDAQGRRVGGAAGWRDDGTPFWLQGAGTGRQVLVAHAGWAAAQWPAPGAREAALVAAEPCVQVRLFARYPLREVLGADGEPAAEGPLHGTVRLHFVRGTRLDLRPEGTLQLQRTAQGPVLQARLGLEDYVARVLDREADPNQPAAAQALAVAARTWVLNHAGERGGCRVVDDDTRAQRVSPQPATPAAWAAARHTQGLVIRGVPVRYHRDTASPGVMSWAAAVRAQQAGQAFPALLQAAYPGGVLAGVGGSADCDPLPEAQAWLREREPRWRATLRAEPGYEPTAQAVQVCRLALGLPQADTRRLRLQVRDWHSREGRLTLLHEYLHLAFRHHPRGADEAYVEALARELVDR